MKLLRGILRWINNRSLSTKAFIAVCAISTAIRVYQYYVVPFYEDILIPIAMCLQILIEELFIYFPIVLPLILISMVFYYSDGSDRNDRRRRRRSQRLRQQYDEYRSYTGYPNTAVLHQTSQHFPEGRTSRAPSTYSRLSQYCASNYY